jgi:hypothetical protein
VPAFAEHNYNADRFSPEPVFKHFGSGMWTAPAENTPEGAVAGVQYAVKRDPADSRRYVTLRVAEGTSPELRHWLDAERAGYSDRFGGNDDDDDDVLFDDDSDDDF